MGGKTPAFLTTKHTNYTKTANCCQRRLSLEFKFKLGVLQLKLPTATPPAAGVFRVISCFSWAKMDRFGFNLNFPLQPHLPQVEFAVN